VLVRFSTAKQSYAVSDKHFTRIKDKQGKRVKTKGEVLWAMRGLPKRTEQLWWDAGKGESA